MAAAADRPNIVFIMADDLGYGDLGCYGQQKIQTPNLDQLAAEGMRFTDYYAGSTVCAPSRSVLMTGLHTGHTRVRGNAGRTNPLAQSLRPEDGTVAEALKSAGYATGHTGKWGLGDLGTAEQGLPTRQGFDFFFGYLNQHHAHNYWPTFLVRNEDKTPLPNEVTAVGEEGTGAGVASRRVVYSADPILEQTLGFIEAHKDKPFFLYFSPTLPHANNEANKQIKNGAEVPDLGAYKDKPWTEQNKGHAAMIAYLDEQVGRLLAHLKRLKLEEKTVVFFTSDNGPHKESGNDPEFFNASGPFQGIKRSLHDGGIRVPMIVRWPGRIKGGSITGHIAYHGDLMATAAELAGATPPAGLDSVSYVPTLLGKPKTQKQHAYLYWEFYEGGGAQAVRMGQWKAVRTPMVRGPIRLYNIAADPGEAHDLADKHPEVVDKIKAILEEARTPSPDWRVPEGGKGGKK
jgi:uncharacterized sulfatase